MITQIAPQSRRGTAPLDVGLASGNDRLEINGSSVY